MTKIGKATQMSGDEQKENQITGVVYTYTGILFSLKKKRNSDIDYNMDEPWQNYAKWEASKKQKENYCMIPLPWGA